MSDTDIYTPTDPRTKYPVPPFPPQKQPHPGDPLVMDPQPDHGEQSYRGHGRLLERRALVTGADSGIGRAVAIAFGREGADVALTFLPDEQREAEQVAELVRQAGGEAVLLPADLSDEQQATSLVHDAAKALGGLDLLVMVAGDQATVTRIEDFETEVFDRIVRTNLHSLFWLTKAAVGYLPPGGGIITTSSVQAFNGSPTLVEYATTKAGIANWTRAMAQQLAERGIRVNGVAPGPFWTPLQPATAPEGKVEHFGEDSPFGRPGQPAELASTYVYLASEEASYTSGETIVVAGGRALH